MWLIMLEKNGAHLTEGALAHCVSLSDMCQIEAQSLSQLILFSTFCIVTVPAPEKEESPGQH